MKIFWGVVFEIRKCFLSICFWQIKSSTIAFFNDNTFKKRQPIKAFVCNSLYSIYFDSSIWVIVQMYHQTMNDVLFIFLQLYGKSSKTEVLLYNITTYLLGNRKTKNFLNNITTYLLSNWYYSESQNISTRFNEIYNLFVGCSFDIHTISAIK